MQAEEQIKAEDTERDESHLNLVPPPRAIAGPIWRRLIANIIDGVLLSIIATPVAIVLMPALVLGADPSTANIANLLLNSFVGFIYYGYFYAKFGASPAKMLMSLRVVDADGANPSWRTTLIRETIGKAVAVLTIVGAAMAFLRADRKGLHDLMAKTQVLHTPRK